MALNSSKSSRKGPNNFDILVICYNMLEHLM